MQFRDPNVGSQVENISTHLLQPSKVKVPEELLMEIRGAPSRVCGGFRRRSEVSFTRQEAGEGSDIESRETHDTLLVDLQVLRS